MYVKDLNPGDKFTTPDTRGTVYTLESVRCGGGYATVTYTIEGSNIRSVYTTRPLSTCTLV